MLAPPLVTKADLLAVRGVVPRAELAVPSKPCLAVRDRPASLVAQLRDLRQRLEMRQGTWV